MFCYFSRCNAIVLFILFIMKHFREYHLLQILQEFSPSLGPIDRFLHKYFKSHRSLGSKDRKYITETLYEMLKWQGLYDFFIPPPITWEKRYELHKNKSTMRLDATPEHIRVSFPNWLFQKILVQYGLPTANNLCLTLNEKAPVTVRINTLKISREIILQLWTQQGYAVSPTLRSPVGIHFHSKSALFQMPEFKQGYFEMQDEGSQIVADLVDVRPGQHVLDYCAGSGGKTLAFAPKMQGQGQIYLHDIRPKVLMEAKKRLKRAGIQNFQMFNVHKQLNTRLMDWIVLDVPCSGTGTLRRNPDLKWRLNEEMLENLRLEQRKIFQEALQYISPKGKIVYLTCSILEEENQKQCEHFTAHYPVDLLKIEVLLPKSQENDGFFAAIFQRRNTF